MWIASLKNGSFVREGEKKWSDIESDVIGLSMYVDGRTYSLPNKKERYFQAKTMSAPMGGGTPVIQSRYIGFLSSGSEYYLRIDEETLECRMEVK
jgi:hypothetical protein